MGIVSTWKWIHLVIARIWFQSPALGVATPLAAKHPLTIAMQQWARACQMQLGTLLEVIYQWCDGIISLRALSHSFQSHHLQAFRAMAKGPSTAKCGSELLFPGFQMACLPPPPQAMALGADHPSHPCFVTLLCHYFPLWSPSPEPMSKQEGEKMEEAIGEVPGISWPAEVQPVPFSNQVYSGPFLSWANCTPSQWVSQGQRRRLSAPLLFHCPHVMPGSISEPY